MFRDITPQLFDKLLKSGVLTKGNHERCARIFYDVVKIIHYRQERLKKSQLKMTEIASALSLGNYYHSSMFRFNSEGPLACLFKECSEDRAIDYFEKSVMGNVTDSVGRKIEIEETGLSSIYKEHTAEGAHVKAPENYDEGRGKRLPWIHHVLRNTKAIYKLDEKVRNAVRTKYIYTAIASIPFNGAWVLNYCFIVVSENPHGGLRFVTSYPIKKHNQFLSRIEEGHPFSGG